MNIAYIRQAAIVLGHEEPISIEPDGTIWTGTEYDRKDLTETEQTAVHAKAVQLETEKQNAKQAVLNKLGLTADEAAALFNN